MGVIGIYGVISYSVSQRTREIGIRKALGCPRSKVIGLFMREGLLLSGIGSACGMISAIGLTRLMRTLLFEGRSPALTKLLDPSLYRAINTEVSQAPRRRRRRMHETSVPGKQPDEI